MFTFFVCNASAPVSRITEEVIIRRHMATEFCLKPILLNDGIWCNLHYTTEPPLYTFISDLLTTAM